jgi:hypothetical protein
MERLGAAMDRQHQRGEAVMTDDFNLNDPLLEEEESPNRTFVIAAAAIGGLLIVSLVCLAVYAFVIAPRQRESREQQPTQIALQNTLVAEGMTQTAEAASGVATETLVPTDTPTPAATDTPQPTATSMTSALLTATAEAQITAEAQAPTGAATATASATALPQTGFADDVGLPNLLLIAGILVSVILVSRALRGRDTG